MEGYYYKGQVAPIETMAIARGREFERGATPDALTLSAWLITARAAARLDPASAKRTGFSRAKWYLERVTPINSYEYARIRFLVLGERNAADYSKVGLRLLARRPGDYPVKFVLAGMLITRDLAKSRVLCKELVAEHAKDPAVYALIGSSYYITMMSKNVSDQDLRVARQYYQKYLQLAPSNDPFIDVAKMRLERIKKRLG